MKHFSPKKRQNSLSIKRVIGLLCPQIFLKNYIPLQALQFCTRELCSSSELTSPKFPKALLVVSTIVQVLLNTLHRMHSCTMKEYKIPFQYGFVWLGL